MGQYEHVVTNQRGNWSKYFKNHPAIKQLMGITLAYGPWTARLQDDTSTIREISGSSVDFKESPSNSYTSTVQFNLFTPYISRPMLSSGSSYNLYARFQMSRSITVNHRNGIRRIPKNIAALSYVLYHLYRRK